MLRHVHVHRQSRQQSVAVVIDFLGTPAGTEYALIKFYAVHAVYACLRREGAFPTNMTVLGFLVVEMLNNALTRHYKAKAAARTPSLPRHHCLPWRGSSSQGSV